jgi:hypothetical protein
LSVVSAQPGSGSGSPSAEGGIRPEGQCDIGLQRRLVVLDGEELVPQDAAQEVVEGSADLEWFPDPIAIGPEFEPQCNDADIVALREARRTLGSDIEYLGTSLPQLAEFPDSISTW